MRGSRAGQGAVLALVLLVCGLLVVIGAASYLQTSGTGRAFGRAVSTRSAIEAADAALSEAAAAVRTSLDTGATSQACPDNWHDLVFQVLTAVPAGTTKPDPVGRAFTLKPVVTRSKLPADELPVSIGDVSARILNCFVPPQTAGSPNPPQGILELSVTVRGPGKLFEVVKTVRQRRIFYATVLGQVAAGSQIRPEQVLLYLTIDPLGTQIE